jgi:hypothetical protein
MCGAVRYSVAGPLRDVVGCHCTQCRRMTGHFMAATAARLKDFAIIREGELGWYEASAHARRGFCARCGSTLFWAGHGKDYISIAAGTLDDSSGLKFACHIHVADKGAYYQIEAGVPQSADGKFSLPLPAP